MRTLTCIKAREVTIFAHQGLGADISRFLTLGAQCFYKRKTQANTSDDSEHNRAGLLQTLGTVTDVLLGTGPEHEALRDCEDFSAKQLEVRPMPPLWLVSQVTQQ